MLKLFRKVKITIKNLCLKGKNQYINKICIYKDIDDDCPSLKKLKY